MEIILKTALFIHIASGMIALLTGLLAMLFKKGGKNHRLSGKIYFWCMMVVAVTALLMSISKDIIFLTLIAVFSFYLSFSGYRAAYLKNDRVAWIDWAMLLILALNGLYMTASGGYALFRGNIGLNPVLVVFGLTCLAFTASDIDRFRRRRTAIKTAWLFDHMSRMLGSYIATFTAFLVVNVQMNPAWLPWLLPTVIGTPMISVWIAYYKRKAYPDIT